VAGFYSARSRTIPPLPWSNFAPPLSDAGVPCSRYRTVAEALDDPISKARGVLGTVEDAAGSFGAPNPPFRMSQSRAEVGRKIPALGEANAEMLRWPKSTR